MQFNLFWTMLRLAPLTLLDCLVQCKATHVQTREKPNGSMFNLNLGFQSAISTLGSGSTQIQVCTNTRIKSQVISDNQKMACWKTCHEVHGFSHGFIIDFHLMFHTIPWFHMAFPMIFRFKNPTRMPLFSHSHAMMFPFSRGFSMANFPQLFHGPRAPTISKRGSTSTLVTASVTTVQGQREFRSPAFLKYGT